MKFLLSNITTDPRLQHRDIVPGHVQEITEYLKDHPDQDTPPIGLMKDGSIYWMWDGHHRALAHQAAGRTSIEAVIDEGDYRGAYLMSLGANSALDHGVLRTQAQIGALVKKVVSDPSFDDMTVREIASLIRCGKSTVADYRQDKHDAQATEAKPSGADTTSTQSDADETEQQSSDTTATSTSTTKEPETQQSRNRRIVRRAVAALVRIATSDGFIDDLRDCIQAIKTRFDLS